MAEIGDELPQSSGWRRPSKSWRAANEFGPTSLSGIAAAFEGSSRYTHRHMCTRVTCGEVLPSDVGPNSFAASIDLLGLPPSPKT